jgi:hypothetical protein
VAEVLNRISYQGRDDWSQLSIWWLCLWHSSYVNKLDILRVYFPFLLVVVFLVFLTATIRAS